MRPLIRPLAAASAAAYLLAGWLAAGLHSHAEHGHCGHEHDGEAAACTTCSCGHHHHGPKASHGEDAPAEPCGHDGCVVCEFLAQPPLAAAAVTFDATPGPILSVIEPGPPAFAPVAVPVSRSRGPPVA
jgi:hypothetical protein